MTTIDSPPNDPQAEEKRKRSNHIVQSTILLMVLFAISKGISLVQTFFIADAFGLGADLDAYVAAARIPDTIVLLLGGGALGYAFIPIFSGFLAKGENDNAWRLASHVLNTFFMTSLIASIIAFVFTPWLMANLIAPAYPPETMAISIDLMRILLLGTLIFSVSGLVMGMLQSHNHFLLPALAPILNDLGILFGIIFLLPHFGVYGMVYGTIIGATLHLLIQIPGLIHFRARWYPEFGFSFQLENLRRFSLLAIPNRQNRQIYREWLNKYLKMDFAGLGLKEDGVGRVILLMLPRLIGLAVFNFNFILMTNIASRLGEGGTSALDWGWRIMQIPETLIGSAMGIVIFPTLAALSEVKDISGKRNAMANALRFILIATIPSSIALLLIGRSALSILEGGAFDANDTGIVYGALSAFTLGLIVHSLLEVIARSFYADKDTLTPLWASLGGAGINLILSLVLSGVLFSDNPPLSNVAYLALANSLGVMFEVVFLFLILRKRWDGLHETSLAITTSKTITASIVMALVLVLIEQGFNFLGLESGTIMTLVKLGIQVALGGIAFVVTALFLGMSEIMQIINILLKRNKAPLEGVQVA